MKEFGGEKDLIEIIGRSNNTNPLQTVTSVSMWFDFASHDCSHIFNVT